MTINHDEARKSNEMYHYSDIIMGAIESQITNDWLIVYSSVYSGKNQWKHQSSASLAFVQGIHWWPVNFPHKWPVTQKMFPLDDVIKTFISEAVICYCSHALNHRNIVYRPYISPAQIAPRWFLSPFNFEFCTTSYITEQSVFKVPPTSSIIQAFIVQQ